MIQRANDVEYGLCASVWSENSGTTHRVAQALDVSVHQHLVLQYFNPHGYSLVLQYLHRMCLIKGCGGCLKTMHLTVKYMLNNNNRCETMTSYDIIRWNFPPPLPPSLPPFPGGHCVGQLLAGERPQCAIWRGQNVRCGQRRAQGLSGVLH